MRGLCEGDGGSLLIYREEWGLFTRGGRERGGCPSGLWFRGRVL